jgi:hypothetical protein
MRDWGFWEWLGYTPIFIAAVIECLFELSKRDWGPGVVSRIPAFIRSPNWAFVPLALLIISGGVFLGKTMGWIPVVQPTTVITQVKTVYVPKIIYVTKAVGVPTPDPAQSEQIMQLKREITRLKDLLKKKMASKAAPATTSVPPQAAQTLPTQPKDCILAIGRLHAEANNNTCQGSGGVEVQSPEGSANANRNQILPSQIPPTHP